MFVRKPNIPFQGPFSRALTWSLKAIPLQHKHFQSFIFDCTAYSVLTFTLVYVLHASAPGKTVQQQLSRKLLTNPSPADTHEHISVHTSLLSPHGRLLAEPRWLLVMPVGQSVVSDSLQPSGHLALPNSYITMNLNCLQ